MYYYIYTNSVSEVENALDKLNIQYYTKLLDPSEFDDEYKKLSTHKFNKNYEKKLTEFFKGKNMTINFSGHSVWIQEIEEKAKTNCLDCGIEINTYGKSFIKRCLTCYNKHKNDLRK
jgi:hypothetical protein